MRALHWFRNDLRLDDNRALASAAAEADALLLAFIFDDELLRRDRQGAARIQFLRDCVERLGHELERRGQMLAVRRGRPETWIPRLARRARAERVYWNRDTSPYARRRDATVESGLRAEGIPALTFKDRVIFEEDEIRSGQGRSYTVFTPYRNAWWKRYRAEPPERSRPLRLPPRIHGIAAGRIPSMRTLGGPAPGVKLPTGGEAAALRRLDRFLARGLGAYATRRDFPSVDGTSRLSPYLRFGALSIRRCFTRTEAFAAEHPTAAQGARKWLDELVWREFYAAILAAHPRVLRGSYRAPYDALRWDNNTGRFAAWCEGRTGYPFVDAGMRQLRATGWMHNRARMVAASFLVKDLLIDWRWGERFFWTWLVDGDPASNNGGWQWCASTGTDAQPYFRIFNPVRQGERFDPDGAYVRRWVPELAGIPGVGVHRPWESPRAVPNYPAPVVDHATQRVRALRRFEAVASASRGS